MERKMRKRDANGIEKIFFTEDKVFFRPHFFPIFSGNIALLPKDIVRCETGLVTKEIYLLLKIIACRKSMEVTRYLTIQ